MGSCLRKSTFLIEIINSVLERSKVWSLAHAKLTTVKMLVSKFYCPRKLFIRLFQCNFDISNMWKDVMRVCSIYVSRRYQAYNATLALYADLCKKYALLQVQSLVTYAHAYVKFNKFKVPEFAIYLGTFTSPNLVFPLMWTITDLIFISFSNHLSLTCAFLVLLLTSSYTIRLFLSPEPPTHELFSLWCTLKPCTSLSIWQCWILFSFSLHFGLLFRAMFLKFVQWSIPSCSRALQKFQRKSFRVIGGQR